MSKFPFFLLITLLFYHFILAEPAELNITCEIVPLSSDCQELTNCKFTREFMAKYNACKIKVQYKPIPMPANSKFIKQFQLDSFDGSNQYQTIVIPNGFNLSNAFGWYGFEEFLGALENGPFLEDYEGFWTLKLFFDQSAELPRVVGVEPNCTDSVDESTTTESTSSAPTTTPTTTTPPKPTICSEPIWVRVIVAEIREFNSTSSMNVPQLDYAVRVGFINAADAEEKIADVHMRQKIEELSRWAFEFGGKHGLANETQKWLAENPWTLEIKQGHFQYAPVSGKELDLAGNGGQAMMQLHNCNIGHFLVAPLKLNITLINHTEPLADDWSEDFRPFERCNFSFYDLATQRGPFERQSHLDQEYFRIDVQMSIGMENTTSEPVVLNQAKCEAFKYKFGYENPLRKPEFNDTADEFKRVRLLGYYLLPSDHACQPAQPYGLNVEMIVVRSRLLVKNGWAEFIPFDVDDEDQDCNIDGQCIKCKIVDCHPAILNKLMQPVYGCPGFKLWIPRLSGDISFTIEEMGGGMKRTINYTNAIHMLTINGGGKYRTVTIKGPQNYKLYEYREEADAEDE